MRRTLQMLDEFAATGGHGYMVVLTVGIRSDLPLEKKKIASLIGGLAKKRLKRLSVGTGKGIARIDRIEVKRVVDPTTTLGMFGM